MLTARLNFPSENVSIDQQTDEVSAIGIIATGLKAVTYPLFLRRLCYLVFWERSADDPKNFDAHFSLKLEQTEIAGSTITLNFGDGLQHRTLVRIEGVMIATPGVLEFSLVAGEVTAAYTIEAGTVQVIASPLPTSPVQ